MNINKLSADTPGCEQRIHLNNAGAGLMPQPVLDAITNHLLLEADIGGYEAEAEAADAIEGSRSSLAQLLGAPTDRVASVSYTHLTLPTNREV